MRIDRKSMRLYAVTDRGWLKGETLYEQVEKAIKGGVTFVQLREKELDKRAFLSEARQIKALCRKYHVPFVINDSVEIALATDADGVHVGQEDMEAKHVREKLGADKIMGVTAKTVEQAIRAQECGADYLGVGAVFPSPTKKNAIGITHEQLREICAAITIPVVAIGGITSQNIMQLNNTGIEGVAVISGIFAQDDITAAAAELRNQAEGIVDGR
ncbi:MAG: thiamine phosphate synthase [Lachnospiraceae bacterium]|nr:thiamine phosphate synthase [Lachnospiraceae bacterium]